MTASSRIHGRKVGVAAAIGVAQLVMQTAGQLILPPILLHAWGDPGYALFVAIQGFAAYVTVSDAGIQIFLIHRLTTLRAKGDHAAAAQLTRGGLRALAVLAVCGGVLVAGAFVASGYPVWHTLAAKSGISPTTALCAGAAQFASGAASLAFGAWSTAVDSGHARYVRIQLFGSGRYIVSFGVPAIAAALGASPSTALFASAGCPFLYECARFTYTYRGEAPPPAGETVRVRGVVRSALGSVVLSFAQTTQTGLQAYITAAMSSAVVAVAVPGRTLANGARAAAGSVASIAWVPIAARFQELTEPSRRYTFWTRNAPLLAVLQLTGVVALLAAAPVVVPFWLPRKSAAILSLLPYFCAEQGAYAATVPSLVLLQAVGRFAALGWATLASAIVSVIGIVVLVPGHGAPGFALANALTAQLLLAPALLGLEWSYWHKQGVSPLGSLLPRACALPASALVGFGYSRWPVVATSALALLTAGAAAETMRRRRSP